MTISVTIMAVPARRAQAEHLQSVLSLYPFSDVSITYDGVAAGTHESEWANGKASLLAGVGKGYDWHIVIQDDAILTPDFYENIEGAINNVPTKALISLYVGKTRPFPQRIRVAVNKVTDETWLRYMLLLWGVGIVIPTSHIQPLLEFVEDRAEPYDTRIGIFYQRNRLPVYYTMPSLVDHNDALGTAIPGHGTKPGARVAHRLATGLVDWNRQVIDI